MELHAIVSDLFKNKKYELIGEIPAELPTEDSLLVEDSTAELPTEDSLPVENSTAELPTEAVEDSTDSSGSLPESLSSWISNPNSITDALELEKSTTSTGDAFDFYPATQTDEPVVFGSKDIIDPGPPVNDSELEEIEAEEEQQGEPVWDYEPEEGERQIISLDRIEEPANQQLNAEITEEQQLNAESTEEQQLNAEITEEQENDQPRREDMVEFTGCMYRRPKLKWKYLAKCITGKTIEEN